MRPSRKYEAHSRLQQGFGGKGREVQKVRATDEIDDTNGYDLPLCGRSHSFIIGCRAPTRNFIFHRYIDVSHSKHANISDHRTFQGFFVTEGMFHSDLCIFK